MLVQQPTSYFVGVFFSPFSYIHNFDLFSQQAHDFPLMLFLYFFSLIYVYENVYKHFFLYFSFFVILPMAIKRTQKRKRRWEWIEYKKKCEREGKKIMILTEKNVQIHLYVDTREAVWEGEIIDYDVINQGWWLEGV